MYVQVFIGLAYKDYDYKYSLLPTTVISSKFNHCVEKEINAE